MEHTERRPRGRFRLSLLQLVLVTLTVAAIGWMNFEFGSALNGGPYPTYGWPVGFYIVGPEPVVPDQGQSPANGRSWGKGSWEGPDVGFQFGFMLLDLPFWIMCVVMAWVVGDPSSVSRTARDRLRKWKAPIAKARCTG